MSAINLFFQGVPRWKVAAALILLALLVLAIAAAVVWSGAAATTGDATRAGARAPGGDSRAVNAPMPRRKTTTMSIDRLPRDLEDLADVALAESDDLEAASLSDAAALARNEQYDTLARVAAVFSAAATAPSPSLRLKVARDLIQGALAGVPAVLVGRVTHDQLVLALGMERGQHLAQRMLRERLEDDNRALRAELAAVRTKLEEAEDARDALVIERDSLAAQLRGVPVSNFGDGVGAVGDGLGRGPRGAA